MSAQHDDDAMTTVTEQPAELFQEIGGEALLWLVFGEDLREAFATANRVARVRAWASTGGGQ